MLKQQFPGMEEEMYLQAFAALTGKTLPRSLVTVDSSEEGATDIQPNEKGEASIRYRQYVNRKQKQPFTTKTVEEAVDATAQQPINAEDWDVLKRVPAA